MNKILLGCIVLLLSMVIFLVSCSVSDTVASGGTDYPNTFTVTGMAFNNSGKSEQDVEVLFIPENYNPIQDGTLPNYLVDTTDNNGYFVFHIPKNELHPGRYNIQAVHIEKRTRFLLAGCKIIDDTTMLGVGILKKPGSIKVVFPDSISTKDAYIYLSGTSLYEYSANATNFVNNTYQVKIDSVPETFIDKINYGLEKTGQDSIFEYSIGPFQIGSQEVVTIDLTDIYYKPQWRFPLIVGVTEQTAQYYGGFDNIKNLIGEQIRSAEKIYEEAGVFKGVLKFTIDSMYQFNTSVGDELVNTTPPAGFAFRLIYDAYTTHSYGIWYKKPRSMYFDVDVNAGEDLFSDDAMKHLIRALNYSRGCIPLQWLQVNAANNNINNQEYLGPESIMNYPVNQIVWDTFSVNTINSFKNEFVVYPSIVHYTFPATLGITAVTNAGVPIPDAAISLFGVGWNKKAVEDTSLVTGTTDVNGEFIFTENPFKIGYDPDSPYNDDYSSPQDSVVVHPNFLIMAVNGADTAFTWLPVTEVNNAAFTNPGDNYKKEIMFK
jgi:hypothetical protein